MPLDATGYTTPAVTADPTLADLSAILRDRTRWPAEFRWDYGNCNTCAMALAAKLMPGVPTVRMWPDYVILAATFLIPEQEAFDIFVGQGRERRRANNTITPEDVADAIDAFLARREG